MADNIRDELKSKVETIEGYCREPYMKENAANIVKCNIRDIWDLFKKVKKPEQVVKEVTVTDTSKIELLQAEVNQLKSKLATAELRANTAAVAQTCATSETGKDLSQLPEPTVKLMSFDGIRDLRMDDISKPESLGAVVNPLYVGMGPFPRYVDERAWVRTNVRAIRLYGPKQYLVNMVRSLKHALDSEYETEVKRIVEQHFKPLASDSAKTPEQWRDTIRKFVETRFPGVAESIRKLDGGITLHQDHFGLGADVNSLVALASVIRYAGIYNIPVLIGGRLFSNLSPKSRVACLNDTVVQRFKLITFDDTVIDAESEKNQSTVE